MKQEFMVAGGPPERRLDLTLNYQSKRLGMCAQPVDGRPAH